MITFSIMKIDIDIHTKMNEKTWRNMRRLHEKIFFIENRENGLDRSSYACTPVNDQVRAGSIDP